MPTWILVADMIELHSKAIELGGLAGVKDVGSLEAALVAPQNKYYYDDADIFSCAASLCFSTAMNHPFNDGNKRTALHSTLYFLSKNGYVMLAADEAPWNDIMVSVVTREISEEKLAGLFRYNSNVNTDD